MHFVFYMTSSLPPFFLQIQENFLTQRRSQKLTPTLVTAQSYINHSSLQRAGTESLVPVQLMFYFLLDTQRFPGSHHSTDYKEKVLICFLQRLNILHLCKFFPLIHYPKKHSLFLKKGLKCFKTISSFSSVLINHSIFNMQRMPSFPHISSFPNPRCS